MVPHKPAAWFGNESRGHEVRLLTAADTSETWLGVADETTASIEGFNKATRFTRTGQRATETLYESADELASTFQSRYRQLVQAIMGSAY